MPYCDRKLHEECGVFGILADPADEREPAYDTYNALFALQHRGQESCGIAICRQGELLLHKAPGLVPDVFDKKTMASLAGASAAIGHVRDAESGYAPSAVNAQPILVRHASGSMALCFNGKLVNGRALRTEMENRGGIFQTQNDAEVISYVVVREHLRTNTLEDAVLNAMQYMIGAYSIVAMDGSRMIAARDPNGYRPLCYGKVGSSVVFASESCAIEALGGRMIRDVLPGEVVVAEPGGSVRSIHCGINAKTALCMFEFIYFARPDSEIDGVSVGLARERAGRCLARHSDTQGDIVIGVPDSGIVAAMGYASESGIPFEAGLMKNRYIARTFSQSKQWEHERMVRIKLNAMPTVKGKRVILVDDSIVRGTTCQRIIKLLRDAGATEVHMKSSAPPFLHPCYFGTAIPPQDQLISVGRTEREICEKLGADSIQFLPADELPTLVEGLDCNFCDACFTGKYAVPVPKK